MSSLRKLVARPVKGQAYDLISMVEYNDVFINNYEDHITLNGHIPQIIKDGVFVGALTNPVSFVGLAIGFAKFSLTASEMDADIIHILTNEINDPSNGFIEINTSSPASGDCIKQSDIVVGESSLPNENPTVGDVLKIISTYFRKNNRRQL